MSYQIIPNWTYLGRPVYTKDNSDELNLSIPVAVAILDTRSSGSVPEQEYVSLEDGARFSRVYMSIFENKPERRQWEQDGFSWNKNPSYLNIPIKYTIYEKDFYRQRYEKLGHFVKMFKDPTGPLYYYFSENPSKGYNKLDLLFYDPSVSISKKAGKKTRKNRK